MKPTLELIGFEERRVYELHFRTRGGQELAIPVEPASYEMVINALREEMSRSNSASTGAGVELDYGAAPSTGDDVNEVFAEMNEQLSALGLPIAGEEEADGIDQL